MRYPSFLRGTWADVRKVTARKIKDFGRGATLDELADDWLDTDGDHAPLALTLETGTVAIHCYALVRELGAAVPKSMPETVFATYFDQAVRSAWGITGLLGQDSRFLLSWDPTRPMVLLDAVAQHWEELDGVGARYAFIAPQPYRLWALPTGIKFALGQIGLTVPEVQAPLPAGGLRELIARGVARSGT